MKTRKHVSANGLLKRVRAGFDRIKEHRAGQINIILSDALMSGFALFALKDPSLLAFDERRETATEVANLRTVYGIESVPCDTQMRTILDDVEPDALRPIYKDVFRQLQRSKELDGFRFLGGHYLLSLDGTGYFSSQTIHCANCLEKQLKNGHVLYHHQMLGAAIVHPDRAEVIPLMPEPIIKQDGEEKNDCERNAAKRFFEKLRQDHPHLRLIVTEDALSSNAPHVRELQKHKLHFILGVKQSDHAYLFAQVAQADQDGRSTHFEISECGVTHRFHFVNQLPLNASNPDVIINFIEYWEIADQKEQYFAWITDFTISRTNSYAIMRGGRTRWKIENETFNTLKNQGYHFEHNFGHGQNHLSVIFALLMMLAFLVDQTQQIACPLFQALLTKLGSRRRLWAKMRNHFAILLFANMEQLLHALLFGYRIEKVTIFYDST